MKKDLLMIAHFCGDFDNTSNNRFNYLADLLTKNHFDVELVTSDFSHAKKMKRNMIRNQYEFKVTLIPEISYSKNVSVKRLISHYVMAHNLKKYLKVRKKPDIIYCAVPSLDVAEIASKYSMKNNIRFIIDVQDLWPETFNIAFNVPTLRDILFYPMKRQADYIYGSADDIIAVSQTYVDRALDVNKKCNNGHAIFLGTNLSYFDKMVEINKCLDKPLNEFWVGYAGTLGHSYDLTCVIDALKILKDWNINNIKLIVMGDGPLKSRFEDYAREKGINFRFTGRLNYGKMVGMLSSCDIAVNPIVMGAAQSIINKHADYAAAGLPVLNTQDCREYKSLVDNYKMGLNCENGNAEDLANKLLILYEDEKLRKFMGSNSRKLAEDKFDRSQTYLEIINIVRDCKNK